LDSLYEAEIAALIARVQRQGTPAYFGSAAPDDLDWLKKQQIPDSVVRFFAQAEPKAEVEIEGIRLVPIAKMKDYNTQHVPGIATSRYGYIVFASTVGGDVYCINVNELDAETQPSVYIVNHDRVHQTASLDEVKANSYKVARSFRAFIQRLASSNPPPYDFYDAQAGY
jgi:hypothetical protein